MISKLTNLALALGFAVVASAASAATIYEFDLIDSPGGDKAGSFDYGARLDDSLGNKPDAKVTRYFSFSLGDASAKLIYDSANKTAQIIGTMVESTAKGVAGGVFDVVYNMSGLTDLGGGAFISTNLNGTGSITSQSDPTDVLMLGAKKNGSGESFIMKADGHKVPGSDDAWSGRGWIDFSSAQRGANDFLFTTDGGPTPGVVPLPAAGWMLLSAFAGAGIFARKSRKAA
ncbi:MAG: VPLPA-CTERM sorting domain-containing protein [Pseudomonadota bacterium]